ncbi:unnamed protein product [Soboliphyme baturini]|uniref:GRIP domain-containing protein n=1 Tax=Soboliphyme baturini TaxID=241478 RepID=A0A183IRT0_9BILA|nr:unnamed protein product [Soboliphyme baturini]
MILVNSEVGRQQEIAQNAAAESHALKKENEAVSQQLSVAVDEGMRLKMEVEKLTVQNEQLKAHVKKSFEEIRSLKCDLNGRPTEDDVIVLQKELVNTQKLMDLMTLQKTEEAEQFKAKHAELEQRLCDLPDLISCPKGADARQSASASQGPLSETMIQVWNLAEQLHSKVLHQSAQLSVINGKFQDLQKRMTENTEPEITTSDANWNALEQENASLTKEIQDLALKLKQKEKELKENQAESVITLRKLNAELSNLKVCFAKTNSEKATIESSLERVTRDFDALQKTYEISVQKENSLRDLLATHLGGSDFTNADDLKLSIEYLLQKKDVAESKLEEAR